MTVKKGWRIVVHKHQETWTTSRILKPPKNCGREAFATEDGDQDSLAHILPLQIPPVIHSQ